MTRTVWVKACLPSTLSNGFFERIFCLDLVRDLLRSKGHANLGIPPHFLKNKKLDSLYKAGGEGFFILSFIHSFFYSFIYPFVISFSYY